MFSEESSHTRLCNGADMVVISPEYRLAPEWPYPAAIEDVSTDAHMLEDDLADRPATSVLGSVDVDVGRRISQTWN